MKRVRAIWELMRLEHGVMIALAIVVGAFIAEKNFPTVKNFFLTFCTALFLEASTFALNDYYDYEIDKKNNRIDRPLVRGDLSKNTAFMLFIIFFPLGIISSYFVNLTCFIIALVTAIFAIFYDAILKRIKLVGNFFIGYVMAIPFVFGEASIIKTTTLQLHFSPAIFTIASIAFLSGVGREIMKDVMDYEGDRLEGVKSFPQYIGIQGSNTLAALFYLSAVIISFIPFFISDFIFYYNNYYYLIFILITDSMILWTIKELLTKRNINFKFLRKSTLIALFIGLIGFLTGAITG